MSVSATEIPGIGSRSHFGGPADLAPAPLLGPWLLPDSGDPGHALEAVLVPQQHDVPFTELPMVRHKAVVSVYTLEVVGVAGVTCVGTLVPEGEEDPACSAVHAFHIKGLFPDTH